MSLSPDLARSLIGVLDEPALIIEGSRTVAANDAARALLRHRIEGTDVPLPFPPPARPGVLSVRPFEQGKTLVRLVDQSAGRAAERMRVDFVANASHELRTPLATIAGYAETMADEGDVDEETRRRFGSVILGEAKRMLRIVEDLMSLSRIEAERFMPPRDELDLGEVARLAADHAAPLVEEQACSIELEIEDDLR